jgi:hypothetical protein
VDLVEESVVEAWRARKAAAGVRFQARNQVATPQPGKWQVAMARIEFDWQSGSHTDETLK